MRPPKPNYAGLDADLAQGMTQTARIILDAKVFGLIPDRETCADWQMGRLQALLEQVNQKWDSYGHLPSALPDDLRARHQQIYADAVKTARANGWDPDAEVEED